MKVLYNWLKDFVDVKVPAEELASRLSLSGSNIGAVENSASGAVLDADLTSNRPDCLGHYGMAREIAALYRLPLKSVPWGIPPSTTSWTPQTTYCSSLATRYTHSTTISLPITVSWYAARVPAKK